MQGTAQEVEENIVKENEGGEQASPEETSGEAQAQPEAKSPFQVKVEKALIDAGWSAEDERFEFAVFHIVANYRPTEALIKKARKYAGMAILAPTVLPDGTKKDIKIPVL